LLAARFIPSALPVPDSLPHALAHALPFQRGRRRLLLLLRPRVSFILLVAPGLFFFVMSKTFLIHFFPFSSCVVLFVFLFVFLFFVTILPSTLPVQTLLSGRLLLLRGCRVGSERKQPFGPTGVTACLRSRHLRALTFFFIRGGGG
jgi:hypothetical protein